MCTLCKTNHVYHVYNQLCKVNTRFREITHRLVSILPRIYFSTDGEAGSISVKRLIKKFGPSSGVVLEVRRIISSQKWENAWLALRFLGLGWFIILDIILVYYPRHILEEKVAYLVQTLVIKTSMFSKKRVTYSFSL